MSERESDILSVILWLALTVVAGVFVSSCSHKEGYEEGYIKACGDAHQGRLRYELKENPDGTRTWEKKEEAKDE